MAEPRRSVLAVAVLSMLAEAPMHAYRMQQLIKERRKDDVVNVTQRNSVYQTIERLLRDGLVEVAGTDRDAGRPERTTYRVTETGRRHLADWMREMLSTPAAEFPEFPAALSFLPVLPAVEVAALLRERVARLEERASALDAELAWGAEHLPRVFVVESEFVRRVLAAELDYLRSLVDDVEAGSVGWSDPPGATT
jgi:DNA-binding PadR family transcriptional regulator